MGDWAANKVNKVQSGGGSEITVHVTFTNTVRNLSFDKDFSITRQQSGWPDNVINDRLDELNAMDTQFDAIKSGPPDPRPEPKPPTQEDLDFQAYTVLVQNYKNVLAAFKAGVGGTTQGEVDAAIAAIKAAYSAAETASYKMDRWSQMLQGLF